MAYLAVTRPDASVNSTQFRILLFLFVVIVFSRVEFHGADAMRTARRPVRVFSCDESVFKKILRTYFDRFDLRTCLILSVTLARPVIDVSVDFSW